MTYKMLISKCCNSQVTIEGNTTKFYACQKCKKACDIVNNYICFNCWKKYKKPWNWMYTMHKSECRECGKTTSVSHIRDFNYCREILIK